MSEPIRSDSCIPHLEESTGIGRGHMTHNSCGEVAIPDSGRIVAPEWQIWLTNSVRVGRGLSPLTTDEEKRLS